MKRERLTEEEAYLVDCFRLVNEYGKERVLEALEAMICSGLYEPARIIEFTGAAQRKNDLL